MIRLPAALAALPLLAVPALAATPAALEPGAYLATVHPEPIPIPAALEREAGPVFRKMMSETYTDKLCLKRKAAVDPLPLFAFRGDDNKSQKNCAATRIVLKNGRIEGDAACTESGRSFTATVTGTYTANSFVYSITRANGGLDRPGTVALRVDAKRTGPCG